MRVKSRDTLNEDEKRRAEKVGSDALGDEQLAFSAVVEVGKPLCKTPEGWRSSVIDSAKTESEDGPAMNGTPSSCAAVWWHVPARPMKGTLYSFATPTTARARVILRAVIPYTAPWGLI